MEEHKVCTSCKVVKSMLTVPEIHVRCRLAMDEPNLQCTPKPKAFVVPTTQMHGSPAHGHRIHNANVR